MTLLLQEFLRQYGYLAPFRPSDLDNEPTNIQTAILEFQKFVGLPQTGVADSATLAKMDAPRCGNSDRQITFNKRRRKRYMLTTGDIWLKRTLTYNVFDYSAKVNAAILRWTLERAFAYWSAVTTLKFTRLDVYDPDQVDIAIRFVVGDHGDESPFDGPGKALAHAFYPRKGDIHFDDAESWTALYYTGSKKKDLLTVAVHEIGHSLGLNHSEKVEAVMAPYYKNYSPGTFRLNEDDITGIHALYGEKRTTISPKASSATPGASRPMLTYYGTTTRCPLLGCGSVGPTNSPPVQPSAYPSTPNAFSKNPVYWKTTNYNGGGWNTVPGVSLISKQTNYWGKNTIPGWPGTLPKTTFYGQKVPVVGPYTVTKYKPRGNTLPGISQIPTKWYSHGVTPGYTFGYTKPNGPFPSLSTVTNFPGAPGTNWPGSVPPITLPGPGPSRSTTDLAGPMPTVTKWPWVGPSGVPVTNRPGVVLSGVPVTKFGEQSTGTTFKGRTTLGKILQNSFPVTPTRMAVVKVFN